MSQINDKPTWTRESFYDMCLTVGVGRMNALPGGFKLLRC